MQHRNRKQEIINTNNQLKFYTFLSLFRAQLRFSLLLFLLITADLGFKKHFPD